MPSKTQCLLRNYDISALTGFLSENPSTQLPGHFEPWELLCENAADLLSQRKFREKIDNTLPVLNHHDLSEKRDLELAHLQLCTLASGYVWEKGEHCIPTRLPPQIAVPLWSVAERLDMRPIVCHAACVLHNFQILPKSTSLQRNLNSCSDHFESSLKIQDFDPDNHQAKDYEGKNSWQPPDESLRMLGMKLIHDTDMDHFFRITAKMELAFTKMPGRFLDTIYAVNNDEDVEFATDSFKSLAETFRTLAGHVPEMYAKVNPNVFFSRIRPFLAGYSGKAFQKHGGIIFEGISDQPQTFAGGSAAQSAILQSADSFLGLSHHASERGSTEDTSTSAAAPFLREMRSYMPKPHRAYLTHLDKGGLGIRKFVESHSEMTQKTQVTSDLVTAYNAAIEAVGDFRAKHIQMVCAYITIPSRTGMIRKPSRDAPSLDTEGTGGTGIMTFLKQVRDSTNRNKLLSGQGPMPAI